MEYYSLENLPIYDNVMAFYLVPEVHGALFGNLHVNKLQKMALILNF